jgi:hypothetical protein
MVSHNKVASRRYLQLQKVARSKNPIKATIHIPSGIVSRTRRSSRISSSLTLDTFDTGPSVILFAMLESLLFIAYTEKVPTCLSRRLAAILRRCVCPPFALRNSE